MTEETRGPAISVTSTDEQVVSLLAEGNPQAIDMLYERYGRLAYSLAFRVLGDGAAAEDVVQDAFLSVWRRSSTFEASRGSLRTWLCSIVHHRALDRLRGRSGRARFDLTLDKATAETAVTDTWEIVADALERDQIRTALGGLPAEQRQTIELAYYGGYSQSEISDLMRVPLGTVKGRTRMALRKLRGALETHGVGWNTT
ncbi:MAG TPA: sigma-70 family RNA polymerase sigma factor [Candidatus Dormibacteraeota bacterium]|nr:sigma-70 family RNA polymerase sigma factor [Candidatus Dormibacteraeota bacterium]